MRNEFKCEMGVSMAALLYSKNQVELAEKIADEVYNMNYPGCTAGMLHVQMIFDGRFDEWIEDMKRRGLQDVSKLEALEDEPKEQVLEGMSTVIANDVKNTIGVEAYMEIVMEWNYFIND